VQAAASVLISSSKRKELMSAAITELKQRLVDQAPARPMTLQSWRLNRMACVSCRWTRSESQGLVETVEDAESAQLASFSGVLGRYPGLPSPPSLRPHASSYRPVLPPIQPMPLGATTALPQWHTRAHFG
jgi:hypothetical protein